MQSRCGWGLGMPGASAEWQMRQKSDLVELSLCQRPNGGREAQQTQGGLVAGSVAATEMRQKSDN